MDETRIAAWLVLHPFVRTELLMIVAAVSAMAKKDWETFKAFQLDDPKVTFKWRVAAWQYFQGVLIGGLPPLAFKVVQILGG